MFIFIIFTYIILFIILGGYNDIFFDAQYFTLILGGSFVYILVTNSFKDFINGINVLNATSKNAILEHFSEEELNKSYIFYNSLEKFLIVITISMTAFRFIGPYCYITPILYTTIIIALFIFPIKYKIKTVDNYDNKINEK
jgi:hypothetical protein